MGLLGVTLYLFYGGGGLVSIPVPLGLPGTEKMEIHPFLNRAYHKLSVLKGKMAELKNLQIYQSSWDTIELQECRPIVLRFHFLFMKRSLFFPLKVTDVKDFVQLKHEGGLGRNEIIPL